MSVEYPHSVIGLCSVASNQEYEQNTSICNFCKLIYYKTVKGNAIISLTMRPSLDTYILFLHANILLFSLVLLILLDYQRLMTVAEGITTLIFPFQWQHIYLPIVSAPLHHLLEAPVPFLMGIQRREGAQRSSLHLPHEVHN